MWLRIFRFYVMLVKHQINSYVCMPFLRHVNIQGVSTEERKLMNRIRKQVVRMGVFLLYNQVDKIIKLRVDNLQKV